MIEKINPTIPIPITSSPIPDEQREIIMAKSSIAIPNPIFFIVNPPLQMSIFSILQTWIYAFLLSDLKNNPLTINISTAWTSEAINCPIAATGIGCNGHGSTNEARQALKTQTTVRKK